MLWGGTYVHFHISRPGQEEKDGIIHLAPVLVYTAQPEQ